LPTAPALDTGSADLAPALDAERIARPQGGGIDLGAYEWHEPVVAPVDAGVAGAGGAGGSAGTGGGTTAGGTGGAGGGTSPAQHASAGCGCGVAGRPSALGAWALVVLLAARARRRRG
jgi:MYXO-CTERM domain-containing protein